MTNLHIGAEVYRHPLPTAYIGNITKIDDKKVTVDFFDFITVFWRDDFRVARIQGTNRTVLTLKSGTVGATIKDFRRNASRQTAVTVH